MLMAWYSAIVLSAPAAERNPWLATTRFFNKAVILFDDVVHDDTGSAGSTSRLLSVR
jgi:hypothetical protein